MGASAAVHPTSETLQSYGLGRLDDALSASVNKHLESCSDCQRRVAVVSVGHLSMGLIARVQLHGVSGADLGIWRSRKRRLTISAVRGDNRVCGRCGTQEGVQGR
jgi:hypothetical protein